MRARRPIGNFPPRSPLRSFALGGLVGAAGAVATVRRLRRASQAHAGGLAAFETAPCFAEQAAHEQPEQPEDDEQGEVAADEPGR